MRIKGVLTPAGAHVTLFSVLAPRRVHILARCRGSACPRAAWRHTASTRLTRLRPFERDLRAGTRIAVLVRAPDRIGKFSAFVIRRGLAPRRRDSCVMPGGSRSVRCPEALLR